MLRMSAEDGFGRDSARRPAPPTCLQCQDQLLGVFAVQVGAEKARVPGQRINPLVVLLLGAVGEVVAVPAAAVLSARREVELGYPCPTGSTVGH